MPDTPDLVTYVLLDRYVAGDCTVAERQSVDRWLASDPLHAAKLKEARLVRELSRQSDDRSAAKASWHSLSQSLNLPSAPEPSRPVAATASGRISRTLPVWIAVGMSFMLVVGVALVSGHRHASGAETGRAYVTGAGERLNVTLADGSQMVLAPLSRAVVAGIYESGRRDIRLQGEAYFTVVHDLSHPFAVYTPGAVTQDVGTAFDVRAYPEDGRVRVAVTDGIVTVRSTACLASSCVTQAERGDVAMVEQNAVQVHHLADVSDYTMWMQGGLAFNATPLREVIRDVSRTFGVTIRLADTTLASQLVTAKLTNQPLHVVMDVITNVLGAQYDQTGQTIVIRKGASATNTPHNKMPTPLMSAQIERAHE